MTHILKSCLSSFSASRASLRMKRASSAALALALLSGMTAHAANATWSGAGANDNWSTVGNWATGAAPGSTTGTRSDTATFTSVVGNSATVAIDNNDQNIGSITFAAGSAAFIIGAGAANSGNS